MADTVVSIYHVAVQRRTTQRIEPEEAITAVRLLAPDQVWEAIDAGRIRDGFTVQALALYERGG